MSFGYYPTRCKTTSGRGFQEVGTVHRTSLRYTSKLTFLGLSTNPNYRCLDHFLESDTALHAWESLVDILNDPVSTDILLVPTPSPVLSSSPYPRSTPQGLQGVIVLTKNPLT